MDKKYLHLDDKLLNIYLKIKEDFKLLEEKLILVDGKNQRMYLLEIKEDVTIMKDYVISTGRNGFGNKSESGKTPIGMHKIKEKYGKDAVLGSVFKARKETGEIADIFSDNSSSEDLITSRIIWLDGCEEKNKNTYSRYIYIHGTADEKNLGKPVSHGCIRMSNKDVIELYDIVEYGDHVYISESLED